MYLEMFNHFLLKLARLYMLNNLSKNVQKKINTRMGEWMAEPNCKWPDVYLLTVNSLFDSQYRKITVFWRWSFQQYYAYPDCFERTLRPWIWKNRIVYQHFLFTKSHNPIQLVFKFLWNCEGPQKALQPDLHQLRVTAEHVRVYKGTSTEPSFISASST